MTKSDNVSENLIIRTVTGDIEPSNLGVTSSHEHIICDLTLGRFKEIIGDKDLASLNQSIEFKMKNLYWIRENQLDVHENLSLSDVDTAIEEVVRFRDAGGSSIIDVTCEGLGRDPLAVAEISRRSGVNIVLGSGFYVDVTHPKFVTDSTVEDIANHIARDLMIGIEKTSIRAGVIGEIGCSWPVSNSERKVLSAAALAHHLTGAPIVVHPGRHRNAPLHHVTELVSQGVAPSKVVIAHIDRRLSSLADTLNLLSMGCFVSFDCFGMEPWIATETSEMPMPCDLERILRVEELFMNGYGAQLLLGCDIAMKHRLTKFGGHGYDYLLRWVAPAFLSRSHLTRDNLNQMLVTNPINAFAFVPSISQTRNL